MINDFRFLPNDDDVMTIALLLDVEGLLSPRDKIHMHQPEATRSKDGHGQVVVEMGHLDEFR